MINDKAQHQLTWYKRLKLIDWVLLIVFILPVPFYLINIYLSDKNYFDLKDIWYIFAAIAGVAPVTIFYVLLFLAAVYSCSNMYTSWMGNAGLLTRFKYWANNWWEAGVGFCVGLSILTYIFWPIKKFGRLAVLYFIEIPLFVLITGALLGFLFRLFKKRG